MKDEYEKYEQECERIRTENEKLLEEFAEWLSAKGLASKTIREHCENIDFYVNHFLLYEEALEPPEGVSYADMFLGYWFIRKAMWASKWSIKSNGASLKKFYTFMHEKGKVTKEELDELKRDIKEGMPEWLETLSRYDDPDNDFDDVW